MGRVDDVYVGIYSRFFVCDIKINIGSTTRLICGIFKVKHMLASAVILMSLIFTLLKGNKVSQH